MDYRQYQQLQANMDVINSANHPIIGYQPHIIDQQQQQQWQMKIPKQEPMDDRDDSGINSGNSSPSSESSRDLLNPYTTPPPSVPGARPSAPGFLATPPPMEGFPAATAEHLAAIKAMYGNNNHEDFVPIHLRQNFAQNLLSPPMSEPCTIEKEQEDALQNLQQALKQNACLAMPSSKSSDEAKSDDDSKTPCKSGSNKKKTIKCKHCSLTFLNKEDMWDHYRSHIKQEKLLECPRCAFVTEYKHHFEYHLRNHDGSKPFKCQECSYECVSKSMLNSHMKSHSTVYQYQCANCTYVSKYCHSLKQHLRKYNHKPGTVLSPDGSPNPFSVIDVYGTRRGPKLKKSNGTSETMPRLPFQQQPFGQFPMLPQLQEQMSQFINPLLLSNPALLQNLERIARQRQLSSNSEEDDCDSFKEPKEEPLVMDEDDQDDDNEDDGALDLSKTNQNNNRRKGPAFKLSPRSQHSSSEDEEDNRLEDDHLTTMFSNVEVVQDKDKPLESLEASPERKSSTMCQYCNIDFHDEVLYSMHMGYHGFNNPFTCNLCGESYPDKVRFFLHIGQKQH